MRHKSQPKKRFGQNFLNSPEIVRFILEAAEVASNNRILEVGPGQGVLTGPILETGANLCSVEIDRDLVGLLTGKFKNQKNFQLVQGDILKLNWNELIQPEETNKIIANLAYNISSPFFFKLIQNRHLFASITLMLQKEVALRICNDGSGKHSKDYGILSVAAATCFDTKLLKDVSPEYFYPKPKVESTLIQLKPKKSNLEDEQDFLGFVKRAFNQRRKILLKLLREKEPEVFNKIGEEDRQAMKTARPENLSPAEFVKLYLGEKIF